MLFSSPTTKQTFAYIAASVDLGSNLPSAARSLNDCYGPFVLLMHTRAGSGHSLRSAPSARCSQWLTTCRSVALFSMTYNGFSTVWHRFKKQLEAEGRIGEGLTLKGLRHTVVTTLREAGLDERRIADLLGQKTPAMARHYSRSANLAEKNRETVATLEIQNTRSERIVKPTQETVKPKETSE